MVPGRSGAAAQRLAPGVRLCGIVVLLLWASAPLGAQSRYSQVAVSVNSPAEIQRLAAFGLPLEDAATRITGRLELLVSETDLFRIRDAGFAVITLIPDVRRHYAARLQADRAVATLAEVPAVPHFHLGSMGGLLTLDEVRAELDSMQRAYPLLITKRDSIGRSIEGRAIWSVRLTGPGGASPNTPQVLYTGLHHAREPQGMMSLIYFLWYMLERYGTDAEVTQLLDTRDLTFVPVVNPDGYAYNEFTDPQGGGVWRKNRRRNPDGSIGVDLNRNYGFRWGFDNVGSTGNGRDEVYRGASAFSEPETQAIRDLCNRQKFSAGFNYHSFGNLLIHPFGYNNTDPPDSVIYRRLGDILTAHNYYTYGTGDATVGYVTNGDADDWMYGDVETKARIFSMTPEVGNDVDWFWPVPSRILPLAEENLRANLDLAKLAGQVIAIRAVQVNQELNDPSITFRITLANTGVRATTPSATVRFTGTGVAVIDPATVVISTAGEQSVTVEARRDEGLPDGSTAMLRMTAAFADESSQDSVPFRLGVPDTVFADGADPVRGPWNAVSSMPAIRWDTTGASSYSGAACYTDSPLGEYGDNQTNTFTLDRTVLLGGVAAELRFRARWHLEPEYDGVSVEVSADSGTTWTACAGNYTRPGSGIAGGKQVTGVPYYDRFRREWVEEVIDLSAFLGRAIMVRFRLESDQYEHRDGMYIDDLRILSYRSLPLTAVETPPAYTFLLRQNFPNPFNPATVIGFDLAIGTSLRLVISDILGRDLLTVTDGYRAAGAHRVTVSGAGLASGVYFYRLETPGGSIARRMVLLR
jgi:carboxypeptidase T